MRPVTSDGSNVNKLGGLGYRFSMRLPGPKSCTTKGPAVLPLSRVRATFCTEMLLLDHPFSKRPVTPDGSSVSRKGEVGYLFSTRLPGPKSCTTKGPAVLLLSRVRATFCTEMPLLDHRFSKRPVTSDGSSVSRKGELGYLFLCGQSRLTAAM